MDDGLFFFLSGDYTRAHRSRRRWRCTRAGREVSRAAESSLKPFEHRAGPEVFNSYPPPGKRTLGKTVRAERTREYGDGDIPLPDEVGRFSERCRWRTDRPTDRA